MRTIPRFAIGLLVLLVFTLIAAALVIALQGSWFGWIVGGVVFGAGVEIFVKLVGSNHA